jgi:single-stranded DNA-binding protein
MLRVIMLDNLGGDAELRYAANERPMASFRIAVDQVRTSAAGEREESTEWFRINVAAGPTSPRGCRRASAR